MDAPRLRPRGSNQGGVRQYNERVLLQAIRHHGALPAAELARLTHLTAQTVSQITKQLLDEGLLLKGLPRRGRVGQPSVPLALNPEGAYAIGIKVGRRSCDVLLVDFTGQPRQRWQLAYDFPDPDLLLAEIGRRLKDIRRKLGPAELGRVQGIGVAAPLSLGGWQELLGMAPALAARWQQTDLRAAIARLTELPVVLLKDTAAACIAELVAGRGRSVGSFLYLFVDTFIGGGLVIDSQLRGGVQGNAGAVGSLPLGLPHAGAKAPPPQLLSVASLLTLERAFVAAGLDGAAVADERALGGAWAPHTRRWVAQAADAIALAVNSSACLLDLDAVILDGSFTRELQGTLLQACEAALPHFSWEGVQQPALLPGSIGPDARALGGAMLPLYAQFAPDRELFLKAAAEA
jgi:predicted NBD/HSP70 family sugar kinase